jgi:hypothetical protein
MRLLRLLCLTLSCASLALCWGGDLAMASPLWTTGARVAAARSGRPLLGVSCSSKRACTAVGGVFAERWNGVRWSFQPVVAPAFSQPELDFLGGVSCSSGRRCLAVGLERPPVAANVHYDYSPLAEVWDGTAWSGHSPRASRTPNDYLLAVSCPSAADCIAVGQGVTSALAMGWDGRSWTLQLAPVAPPVMSILNGVSCISDAQCIAVGYTQPNQLSAPSALIEQWNGAAWATVPAPHTSPVQPTLLNAVSCSGGSCTAVGSVGLRQLVERWNGRKWSIQRAPKGAPRAELNGVSCVSSTDCVAVGALTNNSHQSLAEHWNGSGWSIEPTPTPAAGSLLWAVSCPSAAECVAVGTRGGLPLIERSHGTRWSIQRTT